MLCNHPFLVYNLTILPPVSDHCPVVFDFSRTLPHKTTASETLVYNHANTDWPALYHYLSQLPLLRTVQVASGIDEAWITWRTLVEQAVDSFIPTVQKRNVPTNKPWFTSLHHRLRKRRDRLFAATRRLGTSESWTAYRFARNSFVAAIRKAKCKFYSQLSEGLSSGKGTYAWWAKVKRLCKLNRPQPPIHDLEYQGTIAVTDAETAHIFCHQFAQHSQTPPSVDDSSNDIPNPLPPDVFTFQSLSVSEVFQALSSLSVRKSTAGKISNRILRQISGALAASLTALYNRTLESQCLPQEWKEATVIPLYKGKGDRADPSNYRPISLLNGVAKVCESLLSRQVYCYVEECNLISPKQFGFRRHRSTVDQLIYVTSTVSRALNSLSLCDGIFLDFSKAFDRTSHRLIAQCLSNWCAPSASACLLNILRGRYMSVRIGASTSSALPLTTGVPQGTHLGPLLSFLCYMSSLLPFPTIHLLYKCYVRPLLEYAIPIWMFSLSIPLSNTLDRLQATAARAYLASKLKCWPE